MSRRGHGVYDYLPECRPLQCRWERWKDIVSMRFIYQHGENPEAIVFIDPLSLVGDEQSEGVLKLREFARRCHEYDDALRWEAE